MLIDRHWKMTAYYCIETIGRQFFFNQSSNVSQHKKFSLHPLVAAWEIKTKCATMERNKRIQKKYEIKTAFNSHKTSDYTDQFKKKTRGWDAGKSSPWCYKCYVMVHTNVQMSM